MLKKGIVFTLALTMVAALAGSGWAKDAVVESQWAPAPVRIDGADQDWQGITLLTDEGSKAQYAVRNDGRDLYLVFVFPDMMSATTIDITGMKIYFNVDGKKKKDLGLHFFKKLVTGEQLIAAMEQRGEALTEERKAQILKGKGYYLFETEVINNKKVPSPSDPSIKTDAPTFRYAPKQRALVYEFRIPLSRTNQPGGIGIEPGQSVMLGFEWGGITPQIMREMMARASASGGTTREDAGLSGSLASTRDSADSLSSGSNYYRDPRSRLHSFWIDVKLAGSGS
jgi:hypothetical protein